MAKPPASMSAPLEHHPQEPHNYRNAILEVISFAAEQFLRHPKPQSRIPDILARLGQAASASRAYIFACHPTELTDLHEDILMSQRFEWTADGISRQIGNPRMQSLPLRAAGFQNWPELLNAGEVIHGSIDTLTPAARTILKEQDILSFLIMPIFVTGRWWGFIGFDECRSHRTWTDTEISALKAATSIIGAALDRDYLESISKDRERRFQQLYLEADQHARELALLERIRSTAHEHDMPTVFRTVVAGIKEHFNYDLVSVYLAKDGYLELQSSLGNETDLPHLSSDKGVIAQVVRSGQAILIEDVTTHPEFIASATGLISEVAVPLTIEGCVIGAINIETKDGHVLKERDLRLLTGISKQISLVLERAELFKAARYNEERYRGVVESINEVVFQTDVKGCWTYLNPAWTRLSGYEAAASLGSSVVTFIHPKDRRRSALLFMSLIRGTATEIRQDIRYLNRDGSVRWVEVHAQSLLDAAGHIVGTTGVFDDITDKVSARDALETQKRFYENVLGWLPAEIAVFGPDHRYLYCNPAAIRDDAIREWIIGKDDFEYCHYRGLPRALAEIRRQRFERAVRERAQVEWEETLHTKDGTPTYRVRYLVPIFQGDELALVLGYGFDVTSRKRIEQELVRSQERNHLLFQQSPIGLFSYDTNLIITQCNDSFTKILNSTHDVLTGLAMRTLNDQRVLPALETALGGLQGDYVGPYHATTSSAQIQIAMSTAPFFDALGNVQGGIAMVQDITERIQAEAVQAAVFEISEAAYFTQDLQELYASIHQILSRLLPTNNIYIAAFDEASDTISWPYFVDEIDPPPAPRKSRTGLTEYVLRNNVPLLATYAHLRQLCDSGEIFVVGSLPVSYLGVPLIANNRPIGVVAMQNYAGDYVFTEKHREIMMFVAGQIAMALERKRSQEALRLSEANLRAIFEHARDAYMLIDKQHAIQAFNRVAAERALHVYGRSMRIGQSALEFVSPQLLEHYHQLTRRALQGEIISREQEIPVEGGASYWAELNYYPVWSEGQEVIGIVFCSRDITERKRHEAQIQHMAYFDALTDLPNRRLLQERASHALMRLRANPAPLALLYLDLDRFKNINDTLGHEVGDALLIKVAQALQSCLRTTDTLARLGGDEFAFLLEDTTPEQAAVIAKRILDVLHRPFVLNGQNLHLGGSIGITYHPDHGQTLEELLKHADIAMYHAKSSGGGYSFFDPVKSPYSLTKLTLEADLRQAVRDRALTFYYQPILNLSDNTIGDAEALVRWPHNGQVLTAGRFIPLAEESDLIRRIDELGAELVTQQAASWQQEGTPIRIALNLSAHSLRLESLTEVLARHLDALRLSPGNVTVEVTESVAILHPAAINRTLKALKSLGVTIAIDDFGSGYASLTYLRNLPADHLKIDKTLVQGIGVDAKDEHLLKAAINLGHDLGLEVVGEGVETDAQLAWLREHGCNYAQGYLIGRPVSAEQFTMTFGGRASTRNRVS